MPLARGWLRQLDTKLNDDVFYKNKPTATTYQQFLTDNAVEYVAVPDARLTYYGKREATLIDGGLELPRPDLEKRPLDAVPSRQCRPDRRVARAT